MPPPTNNRRPRILILEDGREYVDRFERFWGTAYEFLSASCLAQAIEHLHAAPTALLLDLDFRRTPPAFLVDEQGQTTTDRSAAEAARLVPNQGVFILMALRAQGIRTPAFLFADLNDPARVAFLSRTLAPLVVVPCQIGMSEIGQRLGELLLQT